MKYLTKLSHHFCPIKYWSWSDHAVAIVIRWCCCHSDQTIREARRPTAGSICSSSFTKRWSYCYRLSSPRKYPGTAMDAGPTKSQSLFRRARCSTSRSFLRWVRIRCIESPFCHQPASSALLRLEDSWIRRCPAGRASLATSGTDRHFDWIIRASPGSQHRRRSRGRSGGPAARLSCRFAWGYRRGVPAGRSACLFVNIKICQYTKIDHFQLHCNARNWYSALSGFMALTISCIYSRLSTMQSHCEILTRLLTFRE